MNLSPGARIGSYEIVALLGAGGMGEVYRARDHRLKRFVALKLLSTSAALDAVGRDRFEREAQAIAALNHPHIVTLYSVEDADGVTFLTMEVVEGRSLADAIPPEGLPVAQVKAIALAVTDAVAAAHQKGITHRDLKPGNIMLGQGEHQGRVKVLDFGLAKLADEERPGPGASLTTSPATALGTILGTVAYMSPEQVEGRPADSRSGVFSLGIILFEMATGRRPFAGESSAALMASILRDTPPSITDLNSTLPLDLARVVRRALAKDPERRYQTAKDLRIDLEDVGIEPPALLKAPGSASVPQSATRRRGALVGGIAVMALVVIASLYLFLPRTSAPGTGSSAANSRTPTLQDLQIKQLTTTGLAERAAVSPDGKYVAYVQRDKNHDSVWIRQTATDSNVQIVDAVPGDRLLGVTLTPDGNFVDFVRGRERQYALWRVPFLGGRPEKLFDDVHTPVGWSPDGSHVAFLRRDQTRGTSALIVINVQTQQERELVALRDPELFAPILNSEFPGPRPAWSPDGRLIAVPRLVASTNARIPHVLFANVATGATEVAPLPEEGGTAEQGLEWLTDRTLVLTRANDSGSPSQLFELSYPGGELRRLTNDVNSYTRVSLTADRDTLVTARTETRGTVWLSDGRAITGTDAVPITARAITMSGLAWAADRLLYVNAAGGPPTIQSFGGGVSENVVSDATYPDASADGRTIVFMQRGQVWKGGANGDRRVKLADGLFPQLTPDGRSVVFMSPVGGLQAPWIVPIDGGLPRQIAEVYVGAQSLAVSPDGTSIAFWSQDDQNRRTLRTCRLPSCDDIRVLDAPPSQRRIRYTPDGRGLAYLDPTATNIWIRPLAGQTSRQLTTFIDGATIADFAWSHDGKRLAVARLRTSNDIVLFTGWKR